MKITRGIVLILVEQGQGFNPVAGSVHRTASLAENGREYLPQIVVIINNQDPLHAASESGSGSSFATALHIRKRCADLVESISHWFGGNQLREVGNTKYEGP